MLQAQPSSLAILISSNAATRQILAQVLEADCRIIEGDTVASLFTLYEACRPDLILLDTQLEQSFETCAMIRAQLHQQTKLLLLIECTEQIDRALQAGADDFLLKPVHPGLLQRRIRTLLEARQAKAQLAAVQKSYQEINERFRILFEHSPDAILLLAKSETSGGCSIILDCNEAACRMNGYTREELIGEPIDILNVYVEGGVPTETYIDWLEQDGTVHYEALHRRKDGTDFPIEVSTCLVTLGGQEVVLGIDRDITERKQIEAAEHQQRNLAEALQDTAAALTSTLKLDDVLDRILIQAARVVPHDASSVSLLEGKTAKVVRCWGFDDPAAVLTLCFPVENTPNHRHMLRTRTPYVMQDVQFDPDWLLFPQTSRIRSNVSAPLVFRDEVLGFLHLDSFTPDTFNDNHARHLQTFANQAAIAIKNAQLYDNLQSLYQENLNYAEELEQRVETRTAELRQALKREHELNALKTRFISDVSHEFRTPLSVIMTAGDMLRRYNHRLTEEQRTNRLDQIRREVERVTQLLENVLAVNSGTEGSLKDFYPTLLNPCESCQSFFNQIRDKDDTGHQFQFVGSGADIKALMDQKYLQQIMTNLLSNAVRYSPTGSTITLEVTADETQTTIRVQDEGIGIPIEDQPYLFEVFYRASNTGTVAGMGLGLAIVKQAVELHGGTISVKSQPGIGSTFTVTIPNNAQEKDQHDQNTGC